MAEADHEDFKNLFKRRFPQYVAATAACMGGFSLGCGIGWSAPCVELLKSVYGYDIFSTNVVASAYPLGAAEGLFVLPFLIDRIGRKGTMLSLVPAFMLGWLCIIFALTTVPLVVTGRLLTGACGGMFCVIAPMYTAEICEKEIRGRLGVFFQLLLVIGILYAFCCGFTASVVWTSVLCSIGPLAFTAIMIFMPESPLYYMAKNQEEDARKSMRFFRGPDYDIEPEIAAFKAQIEESSQHVVTFRSFLEKPALKALALAFGLMFAQQFSGINAIVFYAETIFMETGVDINPLVQMVIFGLVQVISCTAAAALIDQLGRRVLMIMSLIGMCVCLVALGSFFYLKEHNSEMTAALNWLPLTSSCLYILAFCFGVGPIPWAYLGEIFAPHLKGKASSGAALFNWLLAFVVTVSFSSLIDAIGTGSLMFFFAIICALSTVFVVFCMVETKGKTFAEIQKEFGASD